MIFRPSPRVARNLSASKSRLFLAVFAATRLMTLTVLFYYEVPWSLEKVQQVVDHRANRILDSRRTRPEAAKQLGFWAHTVRLWTDSESAIDLVLVVELASPIAL